MPDSVIGVWFRKGLRLHDNPTLLRAAELCAQDKSAKVLPFFVLDTNQFTTERFSVNRFRFLFDALKDLDRGLQKSTGSKTHGLAVFRGKIEDVISHLMKGTHPGAPGVKLTHLIYEFDSGPYARVRDAKVEAMCAKNGATVSVEALSGHTLLDLRAVKKKIDLKQYKLPTAMSQIQEIVMKELQCTSKDKLDKVPLPQPPPKNLAQLPDSVAKSLTQNGKNSKNGSFIGLPEIGELGYKESPNEASAKEWPGGETAALERLRKVIEAPGQTAYVCSFEKPKTSSTNTKDDWKVPSTTGLSPYLAQGSLSVRQLWHAIRKQYEKGKTHSKPPTSLFGQLLFRDQFYVLGYCVENFEQPKNNAMCKDISWDDPKTNADAKTKLQTWQNGQTGYPFIDAAMRQLRETGWMHHLARHAVACFLTRGDLYLSWTHGRDFFDKHLLDGDWSMNNANWLWLAGVAPFSSPWFRVYSPAPPVSGAQSAVNAEQTGGFVKEFCPELKNMPVKFIYEPWNASQVAQVAAKCIIGKDYPKRIVDHKEASKKNLDAFKKSLDRLASEKAGGKRPASPMAKTSSSKVQRTQ